MSGRFGGLARRATAIERLRGDGIPLLYVDGGDLLFGVPSLDGNVLADLLKERARLVARGLARAEVAAVNVGRLDLAGGLGFLESLSGGETAIPWVSANLRRRGGNHPFPRWKIVPWGGGRVAVFGLLRPDPSGDAALGIEVADPASTAMAVLKELPPVDGVLCLSNLGLPQEIELAKRVQGITVIVGGGSGEWLQSPQIAGSTWIVHAADKGKFVGVLDVSRLPGAVSWTLPELSHRFVTLDASVADDPRVAGWVKKYKDFEVSWRQKTVVAQQAPQAPRSPESARLFAGSSACRECHPDAYRSWLGTRHARAYLSVTGKEQEAGCMGCHASALNRASGRLVEPAVACEACHGPAANHRGKGNVQRNPSEQVCRRCHRGYHKEQKFDGRGAYEKIRCDRK